MNSFTNSVQKIGVMAPSSFVEPEDIEKSKAVMEERGYEVMIHDQTFMRFHQSAGSTDNKIKALHELYADPTIDAIWAAAGGNRALYILDGLDTELIAKNPKPLIGFSDTTCLLNAIYAQCGVINLHAQAFKNLHQFDQLGETLDVLTGKSNSLSLKNADILKDGNATGHLIGGCLSLFHYLPGTNDCPNLQDAILFLEDAGDEMSRYDRMFAHMKRMGVFEQISALVLGEFGVAEDTGTPFGFLLGDIIFNALDGRNIPIIANAPFGHSKDLHPLPVGASAKFDTEAKLLNFKF